MGNLQNEEKEFENDNEELDNNNNEPDEIDETEEEKTFTQEEVNRMMAKEKRQGKNSVLRSLGFKTEKEAKEALSKYNKFVEDSKSEEEKAQDKKDKENKELKETLLKANKAILKAEALSKGVNKEFLDDVITLALTKMNEEEIEAAEVIEELKEKYSSFFSSENVEGNVEHKNKSKGTGGFIKGSRNTNNEKSLGVRLATKKKESRPKKSLWSK